MTSKMKIIGSAVIGVIIAALAAIAHAGDDRIIHAVDVQLQSGSYVTHLKAGSLSSNTTFTVPPTSGSAGTTLTTNGSGVASWVAPLTLLSPSSTSVSGYLSSTDWTTFNAKQSTLPVATVSVNGYLSSTDWGTFNGKQSTLPAASTSVNGYLSSTDWTTFNGKQNTLAAASTSVNGYLSSTDWTTFNAKVPTTTSISTTSPLSGGGDLSANRTLSISQAATAANGYLSSTDWNTFNSKQATITNSAPITFSSNTVGITQAATAANGYLSSTDWNTFNGKFLNPMSALGDTIYGGASGAGTALSGNITSTKNFLTQTGTGTVSAAPAWGTIAAGDVPSLAASKITSGTLAVAVGGTNLASGTSGGVLAYTASGVLASSGALTANAVVVGGGAGVVPAVVSNNATATNEFLTQSSSGAPAWAALVNADIPTTLTGKTLTGNTAVNLVSGSGTFTHNTTGTITVPNGIDTLVAKNTIDILTNKTLTGNTAVNLVSGSGTLTLNTTGTVTLPNATDTLVAKNTTDILTAKTLTSAHVGTTLVFDGTTSGAITLTPAATGTYSLTLPTAQGGASTALSNNGSGVLSWASILSNPMTTQGDIIYEDVTPAPNRLAKGTATQLLHSGNTPSWSAVSLTADVTGVLPTANMATRTAPTVQKITATGTGTYTTPAGVTWIRVTLVGAGGGGGGSGASGTLGGTGGAGTATYFRVGASPDLLVGNGGGGGIQQGAGGAGGTAQLGSGPIGTALSGAAGTGTFADTITGAFIAGMPGASSPLGGGGGGGGQSTAGRDAPANTGAGGGGAGCASTTGSTIYNGAGGGAGGYVNAIIAAPSATYAYQVGVKGAAGTAGTPGFLGGAGADGYIIVEEYYY